MKIIVKYVPSGRLTFGVVLIREIPFYPPVTKHRILFTVQSFLNQEQLGTKILSYRLVSGY